MFVAPVVAPASPPDPSTRWPTFKSRLRIRSVLAVKRPETALRSVLRGREAVTVDDQGRWVAQAVDDFKRLEDGRPIVRRERRPPLPGADAVLVSWRYKEHPVLGALAWDLEQIDLAMRRATYAVQQNLTVDDVVRPDVRLPRRDGLQLRGSQEGSLGLLVDIPTWIVEALSSQPAIALTNLIVLLSAREAIAVRLRRLLLTKAEKEILATNSRVPVEPPHSPSSAYADEGARTSIRPQTSVHPQTNTLQGALPRDVASRIDASDPLVDVQVGRVRVRTHRPTVEIAVQEGDTLTSVSISDPHA